ncbi:histidine kinase [Cytobacillus firmus]|uniref:histidine kinase n=1 Tax=Cytobacillus firmus TaxID=1399 RepID=UPI00218A4721|nr:histidine kinase [Cytobacillus firmus]URM32302.1 histidine kinase [Cytobacillus firmus]
MKNRKLIVIPIMILVAGAAMWMLNKDYQQIDLMIRLLIAAGAALLSGVISYFLFKPEKEER